LAALIPADLEVDLALYDEGIQTLPDNIEADIVGLTVITGTARRAYELAAGFRARGIAVVMGGPHITLAPEDAAPHADCLCIGYAEQTCRSFCAISRLAACNRYIVRTRIFA
jgi:radical SAM superfamily enzyme YgiQ (UPF0313 family)